MTGYQFTKEQLKQIAIDRGVYGISDLSELTLRARNLMLADMLFIIFTSYTNSGSTTKSHGDYSVTIGAKQITDKADIYKLMTSLYENPEQEVYQAISNLSGGCQWLDY
jgi:hypothetical protein